MRSCIAHHEKGAKKIAGFVRAKAEIPCLLNADVIYICLHADRINLQFVIINRNVSIIVGIVRNQLISD